MTISYNWLKDYIETPLTIEDVCDYLTDIGLEVEGMKATKAGSLKGVVVGKIEELKQHPNADKLRIAQVNIGTGEWQQIVCGAPNVAEGQKVPVATIGTVLIADKGGEFKIKKAKLRGEESNGMICSEKELGVGPDESGILVMSPEHKVGASLEDIYKLESDYIIEIGLTPNRADAMSHWGVARDLFTVLKTRKQKAKFKSPEFPEISIPETPEKEEETIDEAIPVQVKIENTEKCLRYCGITLKNVKHKPSPKWLQNRLKSLGIKTQNAAVDITNYVLHDLGQPLHAFDADKITDGKIIVKTYQKGTKFIALDDNEYELSNEDLMIGDPKKPLGFAGVIGGKDSGVSETTQTIFLESAYFAPVSVRKTAKRHSFHTDASFRFERGTDPNICLKALQNAVKLFQELTDAEVVGSPIDVYPKPIEGHPITLRYYQLDKIAGIRIHREQIKEILQLLDIEVISEINSTIDLIVPPYRVDVVREIDVIEEILRIYGYNQVDELEKISFSPSHKGALMRHKRENDFSDALGALGFMECINNSLTKNEYEQTLHYASDSVVRMMNPLSKDLSVMRQTLLGGLLENVQYNLNRGLQNIRLYEWGSTYFKKGEQWEEDKKLALIFCGEAFEENWNRPDYQTSPYYLKGVVEHLLQKTQKEYQQKAIDHQYLEQALAFYDGENSIGYFGKVNQQIAQSWGIEQAVYFAELDQNLLVQISEPTKYKPIPKFPGTKRDLALLLNKEVSYDEIKQEAMKVGKERLKSIQLFDVYEGDKLPEGKKSYAIRFSIQDENKTLIDKEIDQLMNQLVTTFEKKFQAELRK